MQTIINWHKTSEELPEQKEIKLKSKGKEKVYLFDEPCLVIDFWGHIKPSRYITKQNRWEGHTEEQVPEFWVKLKDIVAEG